MLDGELSGDEIAQQAEIRNHVARIKNLTPTSKDGLESLLGIPAAYWLDLRNYKPAESIKSLQKPILILQGVRDYQVTLLDFYNWKTPLAGRSDVTALLYTDLNHLFIAGEGIITPEEYSLQGHVAEQVISDIVGFLKLAGSRSQ